MSDLQHKWDRIYSQREAADPKPAAMLSQYSHLLPEQGRALDLACGVGGNTFFLAQRGLTVDAWDISPVAISQIDQRKGPADNIRTSVVNINDGVFAKNYYDIVTVSYFLDRQHIDDIITTLKPQGLLFYQTFTREKAQPGGPSNPDFLLKKGELLSLFSQLTPIIYHEEGLIGDASKGLRNEAILIAQKPAMLKPPLN
ncbi:class I SAM-dependent methyltransferase [Cycloclasticus pugetii]|uniref:class I SAM-dependent methyltransferase n=1 Tax=Cycloclasticus pugetii TaxID=34068 RepID=UPI00091BDBF9|nr:methyltransferase domain-containing protein [Cycloclasticus pugetii]SHI74038.1 Tellurite resistance protein TehB [Cycloclasticus pugetii]